MLRLRWPALALMVVGFPGLAEELPDYDAEKVAAHTWVIHGPKGRPSPQNRGFMNNPAFVVTGAGVVIVDAGSSAAIGRMVLRQVAKVTDQPVTHVFVSHIHGDHWLANQAIADAFPSAKFFAHPKMIEQAKGGQAEFWLDLINQLTEGAAKDTRALIPDEAFTDLQEIKVGGITFRAHVTDLAHTRTDVMIEVVEDSLLIGGDNFLANRMPRQDDGSFRGNIVACERAIALDLKNYVPGHGPTGGRKMVESFCGLLKTLYGEVSKYYEQGMADYEMKDKVVVALKPWQQWEGFDAGIGKLISLAVLEAEKADFE